MFACAVLFVLCALIARAGAQPIVLEPTASKGGISIDESLYTMLIHEYIATQNISRLGATDGTRFLPYAAQYNTTIGTQSIADLDRILNALGVSALLRDALGGFVSELLIQVIDLGLDLLCGGNDLAVFSEIEPRSIFGSYELAGVVPRVQGDGLHLEVTLDHVGVLFNLRFGLGFGDGHQHPECFLVSDHRGRIGFDRLVYDVHVGPAGPGHSIPHATLISSPGTLSYEVDGFESLGALIGQYLVFTITNPAPLGQTATLQQQIESFARDTVPSELATILYAMVSPYLPQPGSQLDLSGYAQSQRFNVESILASVAGPTYLEPQLGLAPKKIQRQFLRDHSAVSSSAQVAGSFGPLYLHDPDVVPPFATDDRAAMGVLYLDEASWRHPLRAAHASGVGHVTRTIAMAPPASIPNVPDRYLAPEYPPMPSGTEPPGFRGQVDYVLNGPNGSGIPLSPAQRSWFTSKVGSKQLSELFVRISITPILGWNPLRGVDAPLEDLVDPFELAPLSTPASASEVRHHAFVDVTMGDVLHEIYLATFVSRLQLDHHKLLRATEMEAGSTRLVDLWTIQSTTRPGDGAIHSIKVNGETKASSAPVSLFLRGLFGDPNVPIQRADPRVDLLIEGLTAQLVERPFHGMISIPGLDFPGVSTDTLGAVPDAARFWRRSRLGFRTITDPLCAVVQRWGRVDGVRGGAPDPSTPMLAVTVRWCPQCGDQAEPTTQVTEVLGVSSEFNSPLFANPSRWDTGFLRVQYTGSGDGVKLLYANGELTTAVLSDRCTHYVAATVAGYQRIRTILAGTGNTTSTLELLPYRDTGLLRLRRANRPTDPDRGHHHEADAHVYDALVMQSEFACAPVETCDARVVWEHIAPLFATPAAWIGQDHRGFLIERPIIAPPDAYLYDAERGCTPPTNPPWNTPSGGGDFTID